MEIKNLTASTSLDKYGRFENIASNSLVRHFFILCCGDVYLEESSETLWIHDKEVMKLFPRLKVEQHLT